ncbi:MAG: D-alanine--D-alanine ligase [Candidatus Absconditabacteria bacterium]|nr:D-alanine--D-alanine ligase [Candidatus Absconditabacteria bacterium]MDD3868469.1 D-alanine--D-alanine ligase [Candidatus Absconditabacteria bacterium]MDD4713957.1 D-alanine--D-alanine ligase [Candidatus Absconditabacteria bacterium]
MKKNIAVIRGGYSSEFAVSEKSKDTIINHLSTEEYKIFSICINQDTRNAEQNGEKYPIDKNDFSLRDKQGKKILFDFAYITIHGTPGEDGILQGYFEMIGVPYSGCNVSTSALTFNKFFCNQFLKSFGMNIAESIHLHQNEDYNAQEIIQKIGLPCFVKPNLGGSSFGISKVKKEEEIENAIKNAFKESPEIIIEKAIIGTEVTCGCFKRKGEVIALPITEIVTHREFFDYTAKYQGEVEEITPARININLTKRIQELTREIYQLIGAEGIIRIDYIIQEENIYILEINTTPGMTETSLIPQQIQTAGIKLGEVLEEIINEALKKG